MNKTLKKFATAILVTGATVAATWAPAATVTTNTQVLDNISLALKFYSQGDLNSKDTALASTETAFTTSDLIKALAAFDGVTFDKTEKLVLSSVYSNFTYGIPGTAVTNVLSTNLETGGGTNLYIIATATATNILPLFQGGNLASYVISNEEVKQITSALTNTTFSPVATNLIFVDDLSSGTAAGAQAALSTNAFTNTELSTLTGGTVGYWVTIVPTTNSTTTNVVITQFSPTLTNIFTNASQHICVMTPKSGATAATLTAVDNWVSFGSAHDYNGNKFVAYKETGKDLVGNDFSGTNIASQTQYAYDSLSIFTAWPTNSTPPAGQTNLIFIGTENAGDTTLSGLATQTTKLLDLTVGGTAADKKVFQVLANSTTTISGVGYVGGTTIESTNGLSTLTFNGVTSTNFDYGWLTTFGSFGGNYIGTNFVSSFVGGTTNQVIANPMDVIVTGTVTVTYLSAGPEIVPAAP